MKRLSKEVYASIRRTKDAILVPISHITDGDIYESVATLAEKELKTQLPDSDTVYLDDIPHVRFIKRKI